MVSHASAQLELAAFNSSAEKLDWIDVFTFMTNAGLPTEITNRIEDLWNETQIVGEKSIHIGKIIIHEAILFIEENPHLATGVALGAAIGAMVGLVPFLGPILAPLTMVIGALYGGFSGSRLDREQKPGTGIEGVFQESILLAEKFFDLFARVFMAIKEDFVSVY